MNQSRASWNGLRSGFVGGAALVYAGAWCHPMLGGLMAFLGAVSYGVYVLHVPLMALADRLLVERAYVRLEDFAPWSGYGLVAAIVLAAWLGHLLYDEPLPRWQAGRNAQLRLSQSFT